MKVRNRSLELIVPIATTLVAALGQWGLRSLLGNSVPFMFFFGAVMLSAWYGGLRSGLIAMALSCVVVFPYLNMRDVATASVAGVGLRLTVFCIISVMACLLAEALHREARGALAANREVTERQELLRLVSDALPVMIAYIDRDLVYRFVNATYETWFNRKREEIVGMTVSELLGPEATAQVKPHIDAVLSGERASFEAKLNYAAGGEREVAGSYVPHIGADGKVQGFGVVISDVSERRKTELSAARLAALVESSDDAIVSKDLNGKIMSWNRGAQNLFGYSPEEVVGKPISIIVPQDKLPEEAEILQRLRAGDRIVSLETVRRHKDGRPLDVSVTISPVRDLSGKIVGASKIARDITSRKVVQQEREMLLAAERAARSEAERLGHMKDEFLATLSHELRTPLNAILGWAQILRRTDGKDPDFPLAIETIERNARVQTQIINDLLDMSRIVAGKIHLDVQAIDLHPVIEAALATVQPALDAKRISVDLRLDQSSGLISGDPARMQQIFWNLLSNAIKFAAMNGSIRITMNDRDEYVRVSVSDDGVGIAAEFLPYVFERFRQADASTTRRFGGLGLGLAIVKRIVELHGGTVEASSEGVGKGATFTIALPLASHATTTGRDVSDAPTRPSRSVMLSGVKVLFVDDERDARELIGRILREHQATVWLASSADEGLQMVADHRPNVVLSDIGMPGADGYEFIKSVRKLPADQGGRTPAAALTAFARTEDRTRALLEGYQLHLAKPIEPSELLAAIASLAHTS